ncbi:unnamed protein product [Trichobilharzia szidati]|nr:unnamed protein product [Trichobilharzia szidati]
MSKMLKSITSGFIRLAARRRMSLQSKYMQEEFCILVDETDCVLGFANKQNCHQVIGDKCLLHRAFSLFLFRRGTTNGNPNGSLELLIQRRSSNKPTFPSLWSNTCCSHPIRNFPDEMVESDAIGVKKAAQRKALHELGIKTDFLPLSRINFLGRILYAATNEPTSQNKFAEHEVDYILVSVLDPVATQNTSDTNLLEINPDEVSDVRWVSLDEFESMEHFSPNYTNLSSTADAYLCKSNITPWLRGLITSGLLRKLWSWAEASCSDQSQRRFLIEDNFWDRNKIIHLSAKDVQ